MKSTKIAIIGKGNVGSSLARGLRRTHSNIQVVGNDAAAVQAATAAAEVVILAVPFAAVSAVVKNTGSALDGKVVIDATNALDAQMNLAVGYSTSAAEELQQQAPRALVVKAFNTVLAAQMETGKLGANTVSTFVAGDNAEAKKTALTLAQDLGFDAIDAGPLKNARLLEPLAYLNIQLAFFIGMGPNIATKLLRA